MFITGNASHYINMKLTTDHMPNIPLKGIIAPHYTTLIHLQGLPMNTNNDDRNLAYHVLGTSKVHERF